MEKTKVRVLVVDDSPDYLEAVSNLLATYPCVGAIQLAHTAEEALERISSASRSFMPDLVLLDIALPGRNGLDVARSIKGMFLGLEEGTPSSSSSRKLGATPKVVMVTLYDTPAYRTAAISAGTDGFLSKADLGERLQTVLSDLFPLACLQADPADAEDPTGAGAQTDTSPALGLGRM